MKIKNLILAIFIFFSINIAVAQLNLPNFMDAPIQKMDYSGLENLPGKLAQAYQTVKESQYAYEMRQLERKRTEYEIMVMESHLREIQRNEMRHGNQSKAKKKNHSKSTSKTSRPNTKSNGNNKNTSLTVTKGDEQATQDVELHQLNNKRRHFHNDLQN